MDRIRRQQAQGQRLAVWAAEVERTAATPVPAPAGELPDERLTLFFTCSHPALPLEAQVALTLRFLTGMTTPEVAAALLVPVPTMQQRIVRANPVPDARRRAAAPQARRSSHRRVPGRHRGLCQHRGRGADSG